MAGIDGLQNTSCTGEREVGFNILWRCRPREHCVDYDLFEPSEFNVRKKSVDVLELSDEMGLVKE